MQKTDKFKSNGMAVQLTEILTAEMFARQISGLSAHGSHSAYSAGATEFQNIILQNCNL